MAVIKGFGAEKDDTEVALGEENPLQEIEDVEDDEIVEEEETEGLSVAEQEVITEVSKTMYSTQGLDIHEDDTADSNKIGYYDEEQK